jgi:hemerythrin
MFEWKPTFSVQIREIDVEHQNLFRVAEELHSAMASGKGKVVLARILDRLLQYTRVHFAHEERLMAVSGYPEFASHKAEHEALTRKVEEFQSTFRAGQAAITVQLLLFLKTWLERHIASSDQKYSPYVRGKAVA